SRDLGGGLPRGPALSSLLEPGHPGLPPSRGSGPGPRTANGNLEPEPAAAKTLPGLPVASCGPAERRLNGPGHLQQRRPRPGNAPGFAGTAGDTAGFARFTGSLTGQRRESLVWERCWGWPYCWPWQAGRQRPSREISAEGPGRLSAAITV